jgi:two-component system LytT family response regulator
MMRAVVVDNEPYARKELAALLAALGDIQVVGACANAIQALRLIRSVRPDLLFVDIHMPEVDGFQLVAMIEPEIMPAVVYVTAHDEYALRAFEESAVDYLLKPVQLDRLARTMGKIRRLAGQAGRPVQPPPSIERIPCVCAQGIRIVETAEVEYVESSHTGVHLVTARGEFLTELTLNALEAGGQILVRCHKQILVNLNQIEILCRTHPANPYLMTRSGKRLPVGRRYFTGLKERLGI